MATVGIFHTRERILHELKTRGPQTATRLARRFRVTPMAIRQHLAALAGEGLVEFEERRGKVGRPTRWWRLADNDAVRARFPDSHAELTVGIITAMRRALGEQGLDRVLRERGKQQVAAYRERLPARASLEKRIAALAAIRRDEGYMAEWKREAAGSYLLIEHHCPICVAAAACVGLCRVELELFRGVLGDGVDIERVEYLLEDGRRCVYRINRRTRGSRR